MTAGSANRPSTGRYPAAAAGGHPATVRAAAEVLRDGGNAWDAVLAGGFAATIAEPGLSSLGGGGFLVSRSSAGEEVVVDFFAAAPGLVDPAVGATHQPQPALVTSPVDFGGVVQDFGVGPASVGVPGVLEGYLHIHRRWASRPLARLVRPAVHLARTGVLLDRWQAQVLELLAAILTTSATGRSLYCAPGHRSRSDGTGPGREGGDPPQMLRTGDSMYNEPLADFLEELAAGRRSGFTADELGGGITAADLDGYEVIEREPLVHEAGGVHLAINPAPSFGGRLIVGALESLDAGRAPGADAVLRTDSDPDGVVRLAEVLAAMPEHRRSLGAGTSRGTTHLGVVDHDGNMVGLTTSNGSGSGVFADGLGVHLNNMMGEADLHPRGFGTTPAGERIGSMMAPGLLRTGACTTVIGSGGSERIRSALTLAACRLAAGRQLDDVVTAPRMHFDGEVLQLEPGWPSAVLDALERHWRVNEWGRRDLYFGGAHLVDDHGSAVGDSRRGGAAIVIPA